MSERSFGEWDTANRLPAAGPRSEHANFYRWTWRLGLTACLALAAGCGTTRMTDTQRTATEQLLISNAVDQAVSQLDFHYLAGKKIYFDPQYLDNCVDRGYVVSTLRQQLLAAGCVLQEERAKAVYVVEARSELVGTDRHALLIGIPQMTVPAFVPGQPSQIPEIPVAKKTDEQGVAKIALFAYNRQTGQRLWQSGTVEAVSNARDLWVLGLGPLRKGTIVQGTVFAGEELLPIHSEPEGNRMDLLAPENTATCSRTWADAPPAKPDRKLIEALAGVFFGYPGNASPAKAAGEGQATAMVAASGAAERSTQPAKPAPAAKSEPVSVETKPVSAPPYAINMGGQAETEPSKILNSAMHVKPDG